jgi:hypothetical protein
MDSRSQVKHFQIQFYRKTSSSSTHLVQTRTQAMNDSQLELAVMPVWTGMIESESDYQVESWDAVLDV